MNEKYSPPTDQITKQFQACLKECEEVMKIIDDATKRKSDLIEEMKRLYTVEFG